MKQIATPIIPQTSVVGTADKAIETAFKAADTALETAYKAADKTISDTVTALTATVTSNKTAADEGITSAIADWNKDRQYKIGNKVMRNDAWFKCVIDNINVDPLTDKVGNWGIFNPGSANDVFANRSPTATDVQPIGVKWWDTSFGASTPLGYVSLGNGAWQFLNQITLSRVRFDLYGTGSTYQSRLSGIKFFKADGTQMPDGWWVWGNRAGIGGQQAGTNYTGQSMSPQYNGSGYADLEPNSTFNLSESISKVTGSLAYATLRSVTFFYSNGGSKNFTPSGGNLATCDPAIQAKFGDSVTSVLGETLTAAKLTDAASLDAGRLNGQEFVSAWNVLFQAQPVVLQAYQQATIDALVARIEALENRNP